jgi:F-type H+-transporting ATPase subunit g
MATFQSYFQPIVSAARNPTSIFLQTSSTASALNPSTVLNRVRNLNTQQYASAAVVTAEVIGFFSVGEMLGRFKVVGYRSSSPAHH